MKPQIKPKAIAQSLMDPFETLNSQLAKPIAQDFLEQLGVGSLGFSKPQTIGQEDLARARREKELKEKGEADDINSDEDAQKIRETIYAEYRQHETITSNDQKELTEEAIKLQSEIAQVAKAAGVDTKTHLETLPKKIGRIDIKRLTAIIKTLKIKAKESKSGSELVSQRSNAKRPTGMLAWVSGKQMKIHEQGTMQLQG